MHEQLLLHIINKKITSIQDDFQKKFPAIIPLLCGEKIYMGWYDTIHDCGCSMNLYFKHLENSDNEGIILYVYIPKVMGHAIDIQLMLVRSNGISFCMDNFFIDLKSAKSEKCKVVNNLFKAMDEYYSSMQQIINQAYLPPQ